MSGFESTKIEVLLGTCWWAEAVTRSSTFKMSPQCRAYIRSLQRETSISSLFPGPKGRGGGGVNSRCITHECLHVYMYMVYMYFRWQFQAVPAYMMSQRWLRTRVFLTMPVKDAPRIKNLITILRSLHFHVMGSFLEYTCRCGEP